MCKDGKNMTFAERKQMAIIDAMVIYLRLKIMSIESDFPVCVVYESHAAMALAHAKTIMATTEYIDKDAKFVVIKQRKQNSEYEA